MPKCLWKYWRVQFSPIVTELLVRARKLDISLVFITQSHFQVPKTFTPYSAHYFIMKVPSKWKLQQIAFNHSSDIDFEVFTNLFKKCIAKLYSLFVIVTTLLSDNHLRFKENLLKRI